MTVYWAWHLTHVFFCLTQFGVKMISFALRAIKVAVTMREVIGWSSAKDVIGAVKTATSTTANPLTGMVFFIVGVETLFAVQTIIRSVHEKRKRGATIKMIL